VDSLNSKIIKLFKAIKKRLFFADRGERVGFGRSRYRAFWRKSFGLKAVGRRDERADLDKKLVYSFSKSKIPTLKQLKYIGAYLSKKEIWALRISCAALFVGLAFWAGQFYFSHLRLAPVAGGEYAEGLVGSPKYINPLYSDFSDVDSDISGLVFSSLFKRDANGKLVNDLAESYEVSQENKVYDFKIRDDVKWHNGKALTADDIVFTFSAIKDGRYNSPLEKSFAGVQVERRGDYEIRFVLDEPYAAFLELLTFGILPQDLWYKFSPESAALAGLNLKPIGSGPYKASSFVKDENTGEIKSYILTANKDYYGRPPLVEKIKFVFFPNFEEAVTALNEGKINGIGYLPRRLKEGLAARDSLNFYKLNIPQLTAVFFNKQNNEFLADRRLRQALALAINKGDIVKNDLGGDARPIDGPILPDNFAYNPDNEKYHYDKEGAEKLLDKAGWKIAEITEEEAAEARDILSTSTPSSAAKTEEEKEAAEEKASMGAGKWRRKDEKFLKVELTAVDTPDNRQVVEHIKKFWEEIGVKTDIEFVSASRIETDIIRPRNFEALFYGQILGADPDLYALWHSSQTGEEGLNLSNYANKDVDRLLEDARVSSDAKDRKEKYKKFQEIITKDLPAIFLYSPTYTYVQSKKIKGFGVKSILSPRDRFANVADWYIKTGKKLIW